MFIAIYKDSQGFPRAWGKSSDRIQAEATALIELEAYKDDKLSVGDSLAFDRYTLEVIEQ